MLRDELRACCAALSRVPADVLAAGSVTGRLEMVPRDGPPLSDLAEWIAGEYGLAASVEATAGAFTVRFTRRAPAHAPARSAASWPFSSWAAALALFAFVLFDGADALCYMPLLIMGACAVIGFIQTPARSREQAQAARGHDPARAGGSATAASAPARPA